MKTLNRKIENNVYYKNNPKLFLELKELIENYIRGFQLKLNSKCSRKEYKDYSHLANWINSQLPLLNDPIYKWNTKCYWILNGLTDFPKCPVCEKSIGENINVKINSGYLEYCSSKCAANSNKTREKCKQTTLKKYGVANVNQCQEIKDKKEKYFLDKYNVKMSLQIPKIINQIEQNNLAKYGVKHYSQTKECQEKIQKTLSSKYGIPITNVRQIPGMSEKIKQTSLKHFGVEHSFQAESVKNKIRQTCIKKYGVPFSSQSHEICKRIKSKYLYNKIYFDSKPELAFYIYCTDKKIPIQYHPNLNFKYQHNDKYHYYFPDFILLDTNQIIEIKGDHMIDQSTGKWICPWNKSLNSLYEAKHQFILALNIKILYSKNYNIYINYVNEKYGKKYLTTFKKRINIEEQK